MRCRRSQKPSRRPAPSVETEATGVLKWVSIAGNALVSLFWEYLFGFACFFSPGWANDPLFGPNFQAVLATTITGWVSLMLMTAAAGAGAIVGFFCTMLRVGEGHAGRVYRGWLLCAAVAIVFLSIWVFRIVSVWVWETFPNGYRVASQATAGRLGELARVMWSAEAIKPRSSSARTGEGGTTPRFAVADPEIGTARSR